MTPDPKVDRSKIITVVVVTSPPDIPQVTVDPKSTQVGPTPTPYQGEPTDPNQVIVDHVVVADIIKEGEVFDYSGIESLAAWHQRWHVKLVEDWSMISPAPAEFTVILAITSTKKIEGKRNFYAGSLGTKLQVGKRYIMVLGLTPVAEKHGYPNAEFRLVDGSALEIVGDKACPTAMIAVAKYRGDGIRYPQTVAAVKDAITKGFEARIKLNPTPIVPQPATGG